MADPTTIPDLPLFSRYQYFSPGIFMGLLVVLFIVFVIGLALSWLTSLEISYAAFEKDQGPAAHKKHQ